MNVSWIQIQKTIVIRGVLCPKFPVQKYVSVFYIIKIRNVHLRRVKSDIFRIAFKANEIIAAFYGFAFDQIEMVVIVIDNTVFVHRYSFGCVRYEIYRTFTAFGTYSVFENMLAFGRFFYARHFLVVAFNLVGRKEVSRSLDHQADHRDCQHGYQDEYDDPLDAVAFFVFLKFVFHVYTSFKKRRQAPSYASRLGCFVALYLSSMSRSALSDLRAGLTAHS